MELYKMEELKKLLGEELFNQIIEKVGTDKSLFLHKKDQKVIVDDGSLIPKDRFNEVIEQKNSYKTLAETNEKALKELKKSAEGNTDLIKQIETLQTTTKQMKEDNEKNQLSLKKNLAVKEALLNAGVQDSEARDLLSLKFNPDKIELDEFGKLKNSEELIKPLKEGTLKNLFGETKISGNEHNHGVNPTPLSELQAKLSEAEKPDSKVPLAERIALKRLISEQENKQ